MRTFMTLEQASCPHCGQNAKGTLESLSGYAEFAPPDARGAVEYTGHTEIWWDEQRTVYRHGRAVVVCPDGHEWSTLIHESIEG